MDYRKPVDPEEYRQRIWKSKAECRKEFAKLPWDEKIRIVQRMKKLSTEFRKCPVVQHNPRSEMQSFPYTIVFYGKEFPIQTFAEASRKFLLFQRTASDAGHYMGSSVVPDAIIKDSNGGVVAHVSFNGRVWEGAPEDWTNKTKLLYQPDYSEHRRSINSNPRVPAELLAEARRYASAEEFVRAQGKPVYHGGEELSTKNNTDVGISFSSSKKVAEDFVKQKGGGVSEYLISPYAKIVNYQDVPNVEFKNLNDYSPELDTGNKQIWRDIEIEYRKAVSWAKQNGYDAVKLPLEGEYRIINQGIIKRKRHTIDILKEAWQMTQNEFRNSKRIGAETMPRSKVREIHSNHKLSVRNALSEGKPVPPGVLKDYPELVERMQAHGQANPRDEIQAYHGSNKEFSIEEINPDPQSPEQFYGCGIYLAKTRDGAAKYGNHIYIVSVDVSNFLDLQGKPTVDRQAITGTNGTYEQFLEMIGGDDTDENFKEYIDRQKQVREDLVKQGYKGVIDNTQIVVFDKSAIIQANGQARGNPREGELITIKNLTEEIVEAINNTEGAKILPDGIELDISRYQKLEQFGMPSLRTGVFYLPELKSPYRAYYSTGKSGYGGGEFITGRTKIHNPIIVKAGTGGTGIRIAYDIIEGKGAYKKMRDDILSSVIMQSVWGGDTIENTERILIKYGGDLNLVYDIVAHSQKGNTLAYAIQEHVAAVKIRNAGYDSVLSYSKSAGKPRLSELFDLRQKEYPSESGKVFEYPEFYKPHALNPRSVSAELLAEARKYASAEEFVRAQGEIVYHGSSVSIKKFDNNRGAFFTDDYMNADGYASGEYVYEGYLILKNPLVIDAKGRMYNDIKTEYGKSTTEVVANIDKQKYDGVVFKNIKDSWIDDADYQDPCTIYYAFKPQESFKSQTQLIDIWKQANGQARGNPRDEIQKRKGRWGTTHWEIKDPSKKYGDYQQRKTFDSYGDALQYKITTELDALPTWTGTAWRADTGFGAPFPGATAADVVKFEEEELGNKEYEHLSREFRVALRKLSWSDIIWVAKTHAVAEGYGEPERVEDLGVGAKIITEDGDGGYLIMKESGVRKLRGMQGNPREEFVNYFFVFPGGVKYEAKEGHAQSAVKLKDKLLAAGMSAGPINDLIEAEELRKKDGADFLGPNVVDAFWENAQESGIVRTKKIRNTYAFDLYEIPKAFETVEQFLMQQQDFNSIELVSRGTVYTIMKKDLIEGEYNLTKILNEIDRVYSAATVQGNPREEEKENIELKRIREDLSMMVDISRDTLRERKKSSYIYITPRVILRLSDHDANPWRTNEGEELYSFNVNASKFELFKFVKKLLLELWEREDKEDYDNNYAEYLESIELKF